jgi:hypothetical protein
MNPWDLEMAYLRMIEGKKKALQDYANSPSLQMSTDKYGTIIKHPTIKKADDLVYEIGDNARTYKKFIDSEVAKILNAVRTEAK